MALPITFGEQVARRLGFGLQPTNFERILCSQAGANPYPKLRKHEGPMSTAAALGLALIPDIAELVEKYGGKGSQECVPKAKEVKEERNALYARIGVVLITIGARSLFDRENHMIMEHASKTIAILGSVFAILTGKRLYNATSSLRITIDSISSL